MLNKKTLLRILLSLVGIFLLYFEEYPTDTNLAIGFLIPLIAGLAAGGAGSAFSNTKGARTSTFDETLDETTGISGTNRIDLTDTSTPNLSPEALELLATLAKQFAGASGGSIVNENELAIQEDIAKSRAAAAGSRAGTSLENDAIARGLGSSSARILARALGSGLTNQAVSDVGNIFSQRRFELPLLQDQQRLARLGAGINLFSSIPFGTTSRRVGEETEDRDITSNRRRRGTNVGAGSALGSGLSDVGGALTLASLAGIFGK